MRIEKKLEALGLVLPPPLPIPPGLHVPFQWVRIRGNRAYVAGHCPQSPDGSIPMRGKVGSALTVAQGYQASRLTAVGMLASLKRALGDLDRITAWLTVLGMVNCAPGFTNTPAVINGFSDLILAIWGPDTGSHARSAVGMAELPFGIPVEIEAVVEVSR